MGICWMTQGTQTGALYQPRGVGWRGDGMEGTYVHLLRIHADV